MMLKLEKLTKTFGNLKVLDEISVELENINSLGIIGPSGGGKSTLLRLLAGLETITEGNNCVVIITDNGHGMDETALTKLFEPYFTNKPKGNGLGLANTQNIIFNHKGSIHVNSQMGKGTSFIIGLPVGE